MTIITGRTSPGEELLTEWRTERVVATAQRRRVDLAKIEAWCRKEGHPEKFKLFKSRLP